MCKIVVFGLNVQRPTGPTDTLLHWYTMLPLSPYVKSFLQSSKNLNYELL